MVTHDEEARVKDIEMQLVTNTPLGSDQSTPTMTNVENDSDTKVADVEDAESVVDNPTNTSSATTTNHANSMWECIIEVILITIIMSLYFPIVVVWAIVSIWISDPEESSSRKKNSDNLNNVYMKMVTFESPEHKLRRLIIATIIRAGCIVLVWLVVNLCVPSLRIVTLFQYPLWKWTLLAVFILLGYAMTKTAVQILVIAIHIYNDMLSKNPNVEYVLKGLQYSFTTLVHSVAILVIWLCYFRTDHGLNPSERANKYWTWSFVSLLVGAILWVLKSAVLLKWQANAVHKRFKARILTAGFKIHFLAHINIDEHVHRTLLGHVFLPWRGEYKAEKDKTSSIVNDGVAKDRTNLRIQDFMLSIPVCVGQIDKVASSVMDLTKVTQRENDGIPEIVEKYQKKIPTQYGEDTVQYITEKALKENFGLCEEDAQLLLQELKGGQQSAEITYDTFQKWMVDAHKNCLSIGYTLIDAFEVVSVLNKVIIGFIIVVVILVWVIITELATTKVLVLMASPFLAFSFMFGDTCKTFFQGIIFSFVTHPYDVGDRCEIEGIELEVKRIGILITTFLKIGTKEEIIYPNASLATKRITNHKGEPDPSDKIELNLDSSTEMLKILELKDVLESFFKSTEQDGSYEKNIHVAVKEIGSSIKVSISFTHLMNVHDVSHSQCLQKKNKQRSELLIDIKQFLEDREIKLATP